MRSFIDTNILVYADSADEPEKRALAVALIAGHRRARSGVVSTQVLQEFAHVALRKLNLPLPVVRERLAFYAGFEVVLASPQLISQALDLHQTRSVAFYDALIVQAACNSGCAQLLSEDMQAGATLAGVRIVNPFSAALP